MTERALRLLLVAASFVLVFVSTACEPTDPLEQVRQLQDDEQDFQASLPLLQDLIDERPGEPEVLHRYGQALLARGDYALAIWPLRKAFEDPEWVDDSGLPLAGALILSGSYDDGIEVASQVLAADPDNISALLLRADARVRSRRYYEEALADAERVLELDPDEDRALAPRAVALLGLQRVEEAAVALEELEERYRDDSLGLHASPGYCVARATFTKEKGEVDKAMEEFDACVERFPGDSIAVGEAIEFFDSLGDFDHSNEILQGALDLHPDSIQVRKTLAGRLRLQGKIEESYALLKEGTTSESPFAAAEAWATIASLHVADGDYETAVEEFERAVELDSEGSPQLAFAYADALVIAGQLDRALEAAERVGIPAQQELIRGRIALGRGDAATALRHFTEGVRLWPDNAIARYYTAVAAEQVGAFGRAIEEYRAALRIDVTATDAYLRLARLHAAARQNEAALTALRFQPGERPQEFEAALLELQILARHGKQGAPPTLIGRFNSPERWARATRAFAEVYAERDGSDAALAYVREQERLDLHDPVQFELLAFMVERLAEQGRPQEGLALVDGSLAAHPEAAVFHALRARALVLTSAPADAVRAAYDRALALDEKQPLALAGLAQLEADAGNGEAALSLWERAREADPDEKLWIRRTASQLIELGRKDDAEEAWLTLLRDRPFEADAALHVAKLRVERGAEIEPTIELARRAVRFGGGPEAEAFLAEIAPDPAEDEAPPVAETTPSAG